jgi:hypothetical protein
LRLFHYQTPPFGFVGHLHNFIYRLAPRGNNNPDNKSSCQCHDQKSTPKTIKLVLDTNVFIFGIFWLSTPVKILNAWQDKIPKMISLNKLVKKYLK